MKLFQWYKDTKIYNKNTGLLVSQIPKKQSLIFFKPGNLKIMAIWKLGKCRYNSQIFKNSFIEAEVKATSVDLKCADKLWHINTHVKIISTIKIENIPIPPHLQTVSLLLLGNPSPLLPSLHCFLSQKMSLHYLPGVSNLRPTGCMQPRMAMSAAQHKIVNLLKTLWDFFLWLHVPIYLMGGPRQLFYQCGPETPKGWTPLINFMYIFLLINYIYYYCTGKFKPRI